MGPAQVGEALSIPLASSAFYRARRIVVAARQKDHVGQSFADARVASDLFGTINEDSNPRSVCIGRPKTQLVGQVPVESSLGRESARIP